MIPLRPIRLLGAVFAAALTLTLSPPAGAAGSGDTPATSGSGAVTRSLPQGATACRSSQAKPSSAFAACATPATATGASTATVTVPDLFDQFDSDAAGLLQSAGLVLGTDSPRVDCNELGLVDGQSVPAGSQVAPGTRVNITHGVAPAPPAECP